MKQTKFYKNQVVLSPWRRNAILLVDFFVTLILSCILFACFYAAVTYSPAFSVQKQKYRDDLTAPLNIRYKSGLTLFSNNINSEPLNSEDASTYYVRFLVLTSSKAYRTGISISDVAYDTPFNDIKNEPLFYYFNYFKNYNSSYFFGDDPIRDVVGMSAYKEYLFSHSSPDYYCTIDTATYTDYSDYPYLTKDYTILLNLYFDDNSNKEGETVYNSIRNGYKTCYEETLNEFTNHYSEYVAAKEKAQVDINQISYIFFGEAFSAYLISILVVGFLIPMKNKDKETLGEVIFMTNKMMDDGSQVKKNTLIKKTIFAFFACLLILPLEVWMIFPFNSYSCLIEYFLGGAWSFWSIVVVSLLLMLLETVYSFVDKKAARPFSDFKLDIVVSDAR